MLAQEHEDAVYEFVRLSARNGLEPQRDAEHRDSVLTLLGSIRSSVSRALADVSEEWNSTTVACQLPVELLVLCLSHLSRRAIVASSHVCRHWRRSVINDPSLWTTIRLLKTKSKLWQTYLRIMLERSRAAPLSVTICAPRIFENQEILAEILLRARELTIKLPVLLGFRILSLSAPLLERFQCTEGIVGIPEDLFAGNTKLHSLDLGHFVLPTCSVSALRTIRTWSCTLSESFDFGLLFRQCPNLESLTISVERFFELNSSFPNPTSLSRVHVRTVPKGTPLAAILPDFSPLLFSADRPPPACIEFSHLKSLVSPMKLFLDSFSQAHKWSMTVRSEDDGPSFALSVDSHPGSFTLGMAGYKLDPAILHPIAPLLRDLSVLRITALPLKWFISANITLPSLIHLDVDVPPGGLGGTQLLFKLKPEDKNGVLVAPLLRHLVVRPVEDCRAPGAWRGFLQELPRDLRRWLSYDAEKLQEIVLMQGSLPNPIDSADLTRLQPLAEVICIKNTASDGSIS